MAGLRFRNFKMRKNELSWCLYDAANSAFSLIVMTTMFPVFYARLILPADAASGSATAGIGFANAAAGIIAALAAPLLGAVADRGNSRKKGLMLALTAGCLGTFVLSLVPPGARFVALAVYTLSVFAFTSGNVFYDAMLTDVASPHRMDYISGAGFAIGYIGSVIPFCMLLAVLAVCGENAGAVRGGFVITAGWWAALALPLLRTVISMPHKAQTSAVGSALGELFNTIRSIRKDRKLRLFLLAYFLYIDGVDTIVVMAVPYGAELGFGAKELIAVILLIQIVAFPCALVYGALARRLGAKRMINCGILAYTLCVVIAGGLPLFPSRGVRIALFLLLALIVAANQGGIQALSRSFYGKLIPPERAAEYFGFYNIFGKFAAVLGPALVGASGWLLGGAQYGILSLSLLFGAGAFLLNRIDAQ